MKWLLTALFSVVALQFSNAQSAWTKQKDEGYFQLQYNTIPTYDEVFQESGDKSLLPLREQTQMSFNFYGEYGITDKTTLIGHIPLKMMKSGELNKNIPWEVIDVPELPSSETIVGLGNIELGIRQQLYSKSIVVSAQLNMELNTSSFSEESGLRTGYDAYSFIPTLNIGKGWNKSYIQGFTGAALRTNDYFQSFKIGVEYGYKVHKNLWAIGFIDGLITIDEGSLNDPFYDSFSYMYVNDQEYMAYGLKLNYSKNDTFGFNFGFGGAFSAKRVAKMASLALGVYRKI